MNNENLSITLVLSGAIEVSIFHLYICHLFFFSYIWSVPFSLMKGSLLFVYSFVIQFSFCNKLF